MNSNLQQKLKFIDDKKLNDINKLIKIMELLRDPENGCAWDLKQTFSSISPFTIEEAYEVAQAIQDENLSLARAISDQLYHLSKAFYCDPLVDMHNRMKEALVLLGRLPSAYVRPPLLQLSTEELESIKRNLELAGLQTVNKSTLY